MHGAPLFVLCVIFGALRARIVELKFYWQNKNFKLHLLAPYACKIHYLFPPTALWFDAQLRCACAEIRQQKL